MALGVRENEQHLARRAEVRVLALLARARGLGGSHPAAIGEQGTVGQDQAFAVVHAIDAVASAPGEFGFQGHGFLMGRGGIIRLRGPILKRASAPPPASGPGCG